jgi:hypothetical protein
VEYDSDRQIFLRDLNLMCSFTAKSHLQTTPYLCNYYMVDGIYLCSTRINFDSSYLAMPREYDSQYNCILALSRQLAGTVELINVVLPSFLHMFF